MRLTGAQHWVLALVIGCALQGPALAEDVCTSEHEPSLLHTPGGPILCPVPGSASPEVGRSSKNVPQQLAWCAGLFDAVKVVEPSVKTNPFFVQGDVFFDTAEKIRDRPPLDELEAARERGRNWLMSDHLDESYSLGSLVHHAVSSCGQALRFVIGKP
jgi:hypothetical protein